MLEPPRPFHLQSLQEQNVDTLHDSPRQPDKGLVPHDVTMGITTIRHHKVEIEVLDTGVVEADQLFRLRYTVMIGVDPEPDNVENGILPSNDAIPVASVADIIEDSQSEISVGICQRWLSCHATEEFRSIIDESIVVAVQSQECLPMPRSSPRGAPLGAVAVEVESHPIRDRGELESLPTIQIDYDGRFTFQAATGGGATGKTGVIVDPGTLPARGPSTVAVI